MRAWVRLSFLAAAGGAVPFTACGAGDSVGPRADPSCRGELYCGARPVPPPPDGPSLCAPGACNYQTQEGCPPAETCAPAIDNEAGTVAPACRPAGTQRVGEPCDAARPCERGAYCVATQGATDAGAPSGVCRRLCCGGDWTACDPGESCIRQLNVRFVNPGDPDIDGKVAYTGADLCFPVGTCGLLDLDACEAEGRTCRIVDPTGAVACGPRGTRELGEDCDAANQCGPGMHCVEDRDGMVPPRCRKLCPFDRCVETGCAEDEKCVHFDNDPPGVGECTPNWRGGPAPADAGGCG